MESELARCQDTWDGLGASHWQIEKNRTELSVQLKRIAMMQTEIDRLKATETALQAEIDQLRATNRPMEFEDAQRATPKV
jgi:uncharacterized small protein (DUF1192 family)